MINKYCIDTKDIPSIYDSCMSIPEYVEYLAQQLNNKTDLYGDHKGTWQGLNKPTLSEEGAHAQVEKNMSDISNINTLLLKNFQPEFHILQPPPNKAGDCILFKTIENNWIMIDTGEEGSFYYHKPQLDDLGVESIEKLFFTHAHSDHIGDCKIVIETYKPKQIYFKTLEWNKLPPVEIEWKTEYYHNLMLETGRTVGAELIELEDKSYCLSPLEDITCFGSDYFNYSDMNHNSVMFLYNYHNTFKILLGGDATSDTESAIIGKVGKVDIYKLNHHGAGPGPTNDFLNETMPSIVLVGGIDGLSSITDIVTYCKNSKWFGAKVYDTWVDNKGSHIIIFNGACYHLLKERTFGKTWIDLYDGHSAYFLEDGNLAKNQIINFKCDYYFIEENYRMAENKFIPMGLDYYYAGLGGVLYRNQWLLHTDGNYYYMKLNGLCARNESLFIDGQVYNFDNNGVCLNPNKEV